MIVTLLLTIATESVMVLGYSLWRRKFTRSILVTSLWINLLTQSLLWVGLTLFFRQYLIALAIAEVLIWGMESILLYAIPANQLRLSEALFLSLGMNLASLGLGWFLPV